MSSKNVPLEGKKAIEKETWNASLELFKTDLERLRELPCCMGTVPLDPSVSKLFYDGRNGIKTLDFKDATDEQLVALADACQPASFGRNSEDVLDESYRKAGKLDAESFSINFFPLSTNIVDTIKVQLLRGQKNGDTFKAELYKLNVYGPGSFFKAHVDTPRSDSMFGSLVVILPTKHEGGSLLFRHQGKEFVFDTAAAVSSHATPHAAFVAFYSDVEHEVAAVKSGYRVTLTYNLFYVDEKPDTTINSTLEAVNAVESLKTSLSNLLSNPRLLPNGGLLAFQLFHKYPYTPGVTPIEKLFAHLKGNDALVKQVCESLSLDISFKVLYKYDDCDSDIPCDRCLMDDYEALDDYAIDEDIGSYLYSCYGRDVIFTYPFGELKGKISKAERKKKNIKATVWIEAKDAPGGFEQKYITYGNEACMDTVYNEIYLVVDVKQNSKRIQLLPGYEPATDPTDDQVQVTQTKRAERHTEIADELHSESVNNQNDQPKELIRGEAPANE